MSSEITSDDRPEQMSPRIPVLWQIVLSFVLLMCVLGPVGFFLFRRNWAQAELRTDQRIFWATAQDLANVIQSDLSPLDYVRTQQAVHIYLEANPRRDVYLLGADGRVLASFSLRSAPVVAGHVSLSHIREFLAQDAHTPPLRPVLGEDPSSPGTETIFSAAPVTVNEESGYLYIVLLNYNSSRLSEISQVVTAMALGPSTIVMIAGGCLAIAFACGFFLSRPLRAIAAAIGAYDRGEVAVRLALRKNDELGDIARAFNRMADSIATQIATLESKDRLRRELIADISHDLRTPVAGINSIAQILLDVSMCPGEEKRRHYLEIVAQRSQVLTTILDDLSQLSSLEARDVPLQLFPCAFPDLFEDLLMSFQVAFERKDIRVRSVYSDECPTALADPKLMYRALSNLIENAIRYTPDHGTIELRCRAEGQVLQVEVADSGCGIAAEELPLIFERRYQSLQQHDISHGMSGLGLAIVRKIIERHGSTVHVSSGPESGTVFSFALRIASTPDAAMVEAFGIEST